LAGLCGGAADYVGCREMTEIRRVLRLSPGASVCHPAPVCVWVILPSFPAKIQMRLEQVKTQARTSHNSHLLRAQRCLLSSGRLGSTPPAPASARGCAAPPKIHTRVGFRAIACRLGRLAAWRCAPALRANSNISLDCRLHLRSHLIRIFCAPVLLTEEQRAPDLAISAARGRAITSAIPQRVRWRTGRPRLEGTRPGLGVSYRRRRQTSCLTLAFIHVCFRKPKTQQSSLRECT